MRTVQLFTFFLLAVMAALTVLVDAHPINSDGIRTNSRLLLRRSRKSIQHLRSQSQAPTAETITVHNRLKRKEIWLTKKASKLYYGLPQVIRLMINKKLHSKGIILVAIKPGETEPEVAAIDALNGEPTVVKVFFLRMIMRGLSEEKREKVVAFLKELEKNKLLIKY
ncbi:hypothetical protein HDU67_006202 [Dinochytrium kinnereticum]|nr:hypothetical protein HDU67_006202 [Dinochytrium kinnereticum]